MSDFNESLYFRDLNRHQTLPPNEEAVLLEIIKKNKATKEEN